MQHRLLAAFVWALGVSSVVGALSCDSNDAPPEARPRTFRCEDMVTCGTCTPVLGCGWCQSGDKGLCVSDPHRCSGATTFTWTWEAAFCPADATDAGVSDAAADVASFPDAAWPEATPPSDASADLATDAAHE